MKQPKGTLCCPAWKFINITICRWHLIVLLLMSLSVLNMKNLLPCRVVMQQQRVRAARRASGLVIILIVVLMFQHQWGCESDVIVSESERSKVRVFIEANKEVCGCLACLTWVEHEVFLFFCFAFQMQEV